jgi:chromate transporter
MAHQKNLRQGGLLMQYLLLAWIFFKIGLFTIGGGYAMLPLMRTELVAAGLMSQAEVTDMVAISQMTPGPFALNAATFAGVKVLGLAGGLVATVAVVLPSLIITTLLARYFFKFEDNVIVKRAMWGLRPVVTGLIASAALAMAVPALLGVETLSGLSWSGLLSSVDIPSVVIAVASGVTIMKFKVSPIIVILVAGALGVVLFGVLGL